ncbi:hypothetical protein [Rhizobium gallicum]|uniref:hypothetical protein n=1 Tax=Rhizobium gallicum TaxID=56730 RepID=UPI001EF94ABA|nr:hypothetical protein [Rhizobium gallicum]ULJ76466.1 hypothetical protein L2W42_29245 [Rhizobium gallicum]
MIENAENALIANVFAFPVTDCRVRVEAAMLEMIGRLESTGLSPHDIALVLADASEDYVMFLAQV